MRSLVIFNGREACGFFPLKSLMTLIQAFYNYCIITLLQAMATVNAAINPQQLQHTLQTFERETTKMDMAGELSK